MTGALDGLRVIDLSPTRVGAQISQLFADHGADVIWIEPPTGAAIRSQPACAFWARGKRSVVADLRDPDGVALVRRLARDADVLIETFRPGTMDRLGLGYETLAAQNPRLVHTSVSGFGSHGPFADLQGYEGIVAAKLGVFEAFGRMTPGPRPPYVSVPWCAFSASQVALHGTLAALFERERSGLGQHVETSLAQAFTALDTWAWMEQLVTQRWPDAFNRVPNFDEREVPQSPLTFMLLVALTSDGHWLQFAQVAPRLLQAFMQALGLDWMFTDPEWKGVPALEDPAKREELFARMLTAANEKTLAEWEQVFDADPNVFAEQFRAGPAVLDHPQLVHDGMVVDIVDPERGPVHQPGPLVHLAGTPADVSRPAPLLGADTADVIAGLDAATSPPAATGAGAGDGPTGLPLEGVTIMEFAVQYAAPFGPTLLTDLGARVIKVEALDGDPIRNMVPFPEASGVKVMAGKESIAIDLGTPEGLAVIHDLVPQVDVVMQGFRAGVAERIGLGYETLKALNPDLVYLSSPGYGVGAPSGHRPAYAPSIGAAAGLARTNVGDLVTQRADMSIDEIRHGSYLLTVGSLTANAQADGFAALGVATAILVGLLARERGAGGQQALTTMLNTGAHAMSAQTVDYPGSPGEPRPDLDMTGLSACYRIYDAADGWIFLAAPARHEWARLAAALADEVDLVGDARFATAADRAGHDAELAAVLADVFATRPAATWERDLRAADVACVEVNTDSIESMLWSDEFGVAMDYLATVDHPTFDEMVRMAPLVRMSRSATQALPGVLCGQHTDEILARAGRDASAIAALRDKGIVK